MKWIILLALLTSCGKKTPSQVLDTNDDDGDYIVNELDNDPHIADLTHKSIINGIISVRKLGENRSIEVVRVSNSFDFAIESLFFRSKDRITQLGYFEEMNRLYISKSFDLKNYKDDTLYELVFNFENKDTYPTHLIIKFDKGEDKIPFEKNFTLQLNLERLKQLLNSNTQFWTHTDPQNRFQNIQLQVQTNTYRIFFKTKNEFKILYVSHNLHFEDFLRKRKISEINDVDQFFFPMVDAGDVKRWWYRKIGQDDYILSYESADEINNTFKSMYQNKMNIKIKRENGTTKEIYEFKKPKKGSLYLKFDATQTLRTFRTYTESKTKREGRDDFTDYVYHYRVTDREEKTLINQEILSKFMLFEIDGVNIKLGPESFVFNHAENLWQVKLEEHGSNVKVMISPDTLSPSLPGANYYTWIQGRSDRYDNSNPLNPEVFFQINAQAWIENAE